MTISGSKLMRALKKRFASPAHVLRRLGLDESLLQSGEHEQRQQAMDRQLRKHYPQAHKLMRALAKRFGTPQAALARLGMDAAMLDDDEPERGMRDAFDQLMRKHFPDAGDDNPFVNEMNELLDEHAPHGSSDPRGKGGGGGSIVGAAGDRRARGRDRRRAYDDIEPMQEHMPEQNMGGEDERDDDALYDPLREHLREKGLGEDEIERAVELGKDQVRRRRANGRDRLPINRLRGGRGGHFGGGRNGGRFDGSVFDEIERNMARIEQEPSVHSSDRDHPRGFDSMPRALSEADRLRLYRLVPGLALVGDMWGDGPGLASHRNPYEV
jgi:hypothetical protein